MSKDFNNLGAVLRAFDASREQGVTLSGEFMKLAASFDDLEKFAAACDHAEKERKLKIMERHVREQTGKEQAKQELNLPGAWRQTKSNIISMWKTGKHPNDFKSYSELTIELNKARKAVRGAAGGDGKDDAPGKEAKALRTVVKGLTHAKRIENAVNSILALSDGDQSEVLDSLEDILKDYEPAKAKPAAKDSKTDIISDDSDTDVEVLEAAQIAGVSKVVNE